MENKEKIAFNLTNIHTQEFATTAHKEINPESLESTLHIGFGAAEEERLVQCGLKFELSSDNNIFIIIHVICTFEIDIDSWQNTFSSAKDTITIKKNIAQHLAVFTTGTTRGVLHAKTEGTAFNKYFIPQLNIKELIQEDVLIEI